MKKHKVYIVIGGNDENDWAILGVFSTKEKAENFQLEAECNNEYVEIQSFYIE